MIQRHDQQLTFLAEAMQSMALRHERSMESFQEHLLRLTANAQTRAAPSPPVRPPVVSEARMPPPERCSGAPGSCRPFLVQCTLTFEQQPSAFPTERSRVAYIVSLLTGRARDWGTAEWERQSSMCSSVQLFSAELRKVFDHVTPGREAARGLLNLAQGGRTVADYSIEFRTIAAESNWNAPSLFDAFYNGLSDRIKDELAARDPPADLDSLVTLAIRIDGRLRERRRERAQSSVPPVSFHSPPRRPSPPAEQSAPSALPEPMQLGRAQLSTAERQRRLRENQCLYCGRDGHFVFILSSKRRGSPVKQRALVSRTMNCNMPSRPVLQAQLCFSGQIHTVNVLIDSGADTNLVDITLATQLGIGQDPLVEPHTCHSTRWSSSLPGHPPNDPSPSGHVW